MKFVKWIVIGLGVLIVIVLGIVLMSLNSIVRSTVQSQATSQLGVETTLGGANVSLFGGSLSLSDLAIGSPKGFSAPHMLMLGGSDVAVSLGQLRKEPIHIDSIGINKPTLIIEQQNLKLNFKALLDQLPSPPTQADKTADQKEPFKLIVDHVTVTDAIVIIRAGQIPGINMPAEIKLSLPKVELANVGNADGNNNGAAIKEVVMQLITSIGGKASESNQLPPEFQKLLSLDVGAISAQLGKEVGATLDKVAGEVTKNLPKEIGGALETGRSSASQPAKAVEQGIKGLLDIGKSPGKKN